MSENPDWFSNDALFAEELRRGHTWARHAASKLRSEGLAVQQPRLELRETIDDRGRFGSEEDLIVLLPGGRFLIECKSRNLRFSDDPASYPYPTAFVDTVSGWDQKQEKPRAVILVSQQTGGMLAVSVRETTQDWTITKRRDRVRGIPDSWYEVRKDQIRPFRDLTDYLVSQSTGVLDA